MEGKKETLTIITQNLNWRLGEGDIEKYTKEYPADVYAFQEFNVGTHITVFVTKNEDKYDWENDSERAEEIWDDAFPWIEFRSGYWAEKDIKFAGKEIKVINFHSSPKYSYAIRSILLKRLKEVNCKYKYVILLGDFNASFEGNDESFAFLNCIEKNGFKECLSDEGAEPTYTYAYYTYEKKEKEKTIEIKKSMTTFLYQVHCINCSKWTKRISGTSKSNI